jgi:hypothetical protein
VSAYERIAQLGITLPEVTPPVAAFVPFVRSGNQIFVSGDIAKENGKPWVGQLGLNVTKSREACSVAGEDQARTDPSYWICRAAAEGQERASEW